MRPRQRRGPPARLACRSSPAAGGEASRGWWSCWCPFEWVACPGIPTIDLCCDRRNSVLSMQQTFDVVLTWPKAERDTQELAGSGGAECATRCARHVPGASTVSRNSTVPVATGAATGTALSVGQQE